MARMSEMVVEFPIWVEVCIFFFSEDFAVLFNDTQLPICTILTIKDWTICETFQFQPHLNNPAVEKDCRLTPFYEGNKIQKATVYSDLKTEGH